MRRVLLFGHAYVDPAARGKLRALAARDLDLTVGVPQRWIEPGLGRPVQTTWERKNGVEVFPVPTREPGDAEHATFKRRALVALLHDKRPDLVQVEEEPTCLWTRQVLAAAAKLRVPVVLHTSHRGDPALPLLLRWRRRRILRRARGAVAESEAAAAAARRDAPAIPVRVVPQLGVYVPPAPEHIPHEGLWLGCVGRLVPEKGLDTLLTALARLRARAWHLTVVGDGPDRERLERLASGLRLAARIHWTGALPPARLAGVWMEIDALVAPARGAVTRTERSGHVLAEAMAHEVAVVGSAVGALPDVIGDAGLVVPPGDVEALVEAIQRLADPATRRPLARAGRARAMKHYSDDAVAEKTLVFWRELTG